ncbi:unnamed protein product [Menidia menidia]|uniref:(Atlantic silverside) hypothetical protein n=1 Tax=Menidia menidia TaxID=238744 RepID=A0A8S4AC96_9TELE|nr:unnamed protein product [Menidia menidia]
MDSIRTVVVFLAVSLSAPASSDTTRFLISGPEVVRAGAEIPLAITVFSDFSGWVTAEVAHGNTKSSQTADFQGGLTSLLTLPPIPGSISPNSLLNLTVRGYKEDSLIFTNTTTLSFSLRNVSSFILTDKLHYKPGDTVKIRVVCVQLDNHPFKGKVDISLRDPSGNVVDRWKSTGNLGIILEEFTLSQISPLGQWEITTSVNGVSDEKAFIVEKNDHPQFEVLVKTSSHVLIEDNISGSVRALSLSGQPVHGKLDVNVTLKADANSGGPLFMLKQTKEIYGSTQFVFSKDKLQHLFSSSAIHSTGHVVQISACVTDTSTGFKVNKTADVHVMQNTHQLIFLDYPLSLKPSLHFHAKLKITRYDRKPLSSSDLMHSVVVEVTQSASSNDTDPTILTLPVPEDGTVHIKFQLQDQVLMLFVRVRFQSSEETLKVFNNYSSPSGSYIQLSPVNESPAQIGLPLQLHVESTFKPMMLHFVVSSKGQIVAAGTRNSTSFSLTPTLSWSPEACVTVYCILSNGEVTSDTAVMPIHQPNHDCKLKILTNAGLNEKNQKDGSKNGENPPDDLGHYLVVQKHWSHWMETGVPLLWLDSTVSNMMWTSGKITVPDGVMSLEAMALVMSENQGLSFTAVPEKLAVSKDFSLSLDLPPYLVRGEEIVLEVNIHNYLEQDIEVIVLIAQSEAFEFVLMGKRDTSVINAQKLTIRSHMSAAALFPIRCLAVGEMEISVDAASAEASDGLVQRVMVKPEGVEQSVSQTEFLELAPGKLSNSMLASFSFPPHVVPGSQRAHVALGGDILAPSINNLDSLVLTPTGCGEQNMVHFAPSVYVLQYLDKSTQDDKDIRSKALEYLEKGYQNQLSYQREDGSFSAFGSNDTSGSTWLTAFVLRCFTQAQPYVQVNQTVLTRAMSWLLKRQAPQGEFVEEGSPIHTEMQAALDEGSVALTAYVLLAFLEDETYATVYEDNVSLALRYLESKVSSGKVSNYSLCLAAYALALGNRPSAGEVLAELSRRADNRDGVMMWTSSDGVRSHDGQPRSAQIEMASYVLLALFKRGSFIEGISLMKWLSTQRNHLGGFGTTQDTVVALQALAYYAAFSGANAIELKFKISAPSSSFVSLFQINSTNYRMYQSQKINADEDLPLNIYMEGRGFAIFQLNVFYNVESKAFSQNLGHASYEEAFFLNVHLSENRDNIHMMLSVCTSIKENQAIDQTGMVVLDVGMLSGFSLLPGAAVQSDVIKKVESTPEKVIFYLDSLTKTEFCIQLAFVRRHKVTRMKEAMVQVYDYYEPTRKATSSYNSETFRNTDSCFFCGANCDLCRPGITITVASPMLSNAIRGATFSLSCLFIGFAGVFAVI